MGYAALVVAALAFLGIVVAASRRSRRWWLERPSWRAYRDEVDALGLDEREQRLLERSTRRGRGVPPHQAEAALVFAQTVLAARPEWPVWRRRLRIVVAAVLGLSVLLGGFELITEPFHPGALWGPVNSGVLLTLVLLEPRIEARSRRLLRHSAALARDQLGQREDRLDPFDP